MQITATAAKGHLTEQETVKLISEGTSNAVFGLSRMIGKQVDIIGFNVKNMKVRDIPDLFGGPDAFMVGVYLQSSGYKEGHLLVGYEPETALKLIKALIGEAPQSVQNLSEMDRSILGEIGNMMGSFFLNVISDYLGVPFLPSPPAVVVDMAGAILNVPLTTMMIEGDTTCVMAATFATPDGQIDGKFLVIPVPIIANMVG